MMPAIEVTITVETDTDTPRDLDAVCDAVQALFDHGTIRDSFSCAALTLHGAEVRKPNHSPIHTPAGKREFIRNLCNSVRDSLIKAVARMPNEWDGHELRELLAQTFDAERGDLLRTNRERMRAFKNTCATEEI